MKGPVYVHKRGHVACYDWSIRSGRLCISIEESIGGGNLRYRLESAVKFIPFYGTSHMHSVRVNVRTCGDRLDR